VEFPVQVALAEPVTTLPLGEGWWYEPKLDGHRLVMWRTAEEVRCQARSGRDTTTGWPDLAAAGLALPPGVVLDGEAVIWRAGTVDFAAAQSRAASSPERAAALARLLPASYAVWDVLAIPGQDVRHLPYLQRRTLLVELAGDLGPPIQPVPATDDPDVALTWYESLRVQGVEGLVCKRAGTPYRARRIWRKLRHADTADAAVHGFTGTALRPRALLVDLADGRPTALTQTLTRTVAGQVAAHLQTAPPAPGATARAWDGTRYTPIPPGLVVEVQAGTTRHRVVTVVRVR
jgi:ATP-dependent DNA ligase